MDQLATLEFALNELRRVVAGLDETQMDTVTNCEPWTVRRLASHALNNQLLWAGIATGRHTVSADDTMGAVPYEGDLTTFADDAADRALAMWRTEGVLEGMHATPVRRAARFDGDRFSDHRRAGACMGPLDDRGSAGRVPARDDPGDLAGVRGDLHRRGPRHWSDSSPHRTSRRGDGHRTVDGRIRPNGSPLVARPAGPTGPLPKERECRTVAFLEPWPAPPATDRDAALRAAIRSTRGRSGGASPPAGRERARPSPTGEATTSARRL